MNATSVVNAIKNWIGVIVTVLSGVALVAGKLADVPAPLGVSPSAWAYVAVIGAVASGIVAAAQMFSTNSGAADVAAAAIAAGHLAETQKKHVAAYLEAVK